MAIQMFRSDQLDAPALTGQAGSLITLLDTCLVNGYATKSVSSITRSSATATVTCATAHGLATGDWATIAGATQTEYNGRFKVTVTSPTNFTYTVSGTPATPATGTILARRASGDFAKTFAGANKAAYRANDVSGNRLYLRVLDDGGSSAGAREARIRGYETMTDVDTGTGLFPTLAQASDGNFVYKSETADATARAWILITDGRMIYMVVSVGSPTGATPGGFQHWAWMFGDLLPYRASDTYATMIAGPTTANNFSSASNTAAQPASGVSSSTAFSSSAVVAREFTGLGGARGIAMLGTGQSSSTFGASATLPFPHGPDNGFYFAPAVAVQSTPTCMRGRVPGLYESWHGRQLGNWDIIENVQGFAGRRFIHIFVQNSSTPGCWIIDLTGASDLWD